jgi:hypothetical protein
MRLSSDDGLGRLELDVFDLELRADPPRLAVLARVRMNGYSGERKAWLELERVRRFAMELDAFPQASHPAAVLDAADPDALQLTVLPVDADQLESVVHVSMRATQRIGARDYETALTGAFTLPAAEVRRLAETTRRWTDARFLAELEAWGFDEKALLDD